MEFCGGPPGRAVAPGAARRYALRLRFEIREVCVIRRVLLLVAVLLVALLVVSGCGGSQGQPPDRAETTVEETTSPVGTTAAETTAAETGEDQYVQSSQDCLERQFAQATQGMSPQEAAQYETDIIDEAVQRQMDPRDVLAERGFPC